jgi:uncharacterized membrane protein YfcA
MDIGAGGAIAIALVFILAGFVKGVIGLGLPTISIGLLSLIMPPAQAAALLVVPSFVTNIQQMRPWAQVPRLVRRLWPMMLGIGLGVAAGSGTLSGASAAIASAALGAALLCYAGLGLAAIRFSIASHNEPWLGPAAGFATGMITAATGVFVIPSVPYLQAIGLDKDDLVQALGLTFFVATIALAADLVVTGALGATIGIASLFALVPAILGMWLGQVLRERFTAATFRRWFFLGLACLGAYLVARNVV